jgi:hypothetical protein
MVTYLQGRKISVEQDRAPPAEVLHLIRKLRWMGLDEQAEQIQTKLNETAPAGGIVTAAHETD